MNVALLYDIVNLQPKEIVANSSDTAQDRRLDEFATDNRISQKENVVNPESEKISFSRSANPTAEDNRYLEAVQNGDMETAQKMVDEKAEKEKAAEAVDSKDGVRYNRRRHQPQKISFQHKNFPSETESQSEAHRLAVWWASKSDVQTKDQTLISMNGKWYLVEKFDDSLNHYQVEDFITEREYNFIEKEIKEHGRSGYIKSIQRSTDRLDLLDQQRNSDGNEKSGVDRDETRHGSQNQQIQQMGKAESQKRETASDRSGDREGSGSYRQGDSIRFSRSAQDSTDSAAQAGYNEDATKLQTKGQRA